MGVINVSDKRILEVVAFAATYGDTQAMEHYGIKSVETLNRYRREAKRRKLPNADLNRSLKKIAEVYDDKEIKAIASGGRVLPGMAKIPRIDFSGDHVRFGFITDTHLGSIFTSPDHLYAAFDEFEKQKVNFVIHTGDVTEGMSHRPGHVYELSHIGFSEQKKHAIDVLGKCPAPLFMIDGNHDRWYIKSNGAIIVEDIASEIPHAKYLGHDEADIALGPTTLKLWHGEDGNSYATSYRPQKIIESLTGGEKPGILCVGHTHKQLYMYDRHIHVYSGGSIQMQSKFMRAKRIPAHTGFWIIDAYVNDTGIAKTGGMWHPFYA